jgi:hypothetical protein
LVMGGIFAGDDDGGGVDAVFEGIESRDGLALDRAGSGRLLGVCLIRCDLSWSCHDYELAWRWRGNWGWGR